MRRGSEYPLLNFEHNLSVAKLFLFDDSPKCPFDGQFLNLVFDCFKAKIVGFFLQIFLCLKINKSHDAPFIAKY